MSQPGPARVHNDIVTVTAGEGAQIKRRQRIVLGVAVVCAVASTGGLVASTFVKSPEQARADTSAPPPTLLTSLVQRRVLATTIVTRGSVVPASTVEVTPVVADAGAQVITGVRVKSGDNVQAGEVLLAVSGRPLIVLPGKLPAYRDIKPGDSGDDVRQLQNALKTLGHYADGDPGGRFGPNTKTAVRKLYARLGYDVPDTGGPGGVADRPALVAARDAVEAAQRAWMALNRRISAGDQPGPADEPWPVQLAEADSRLQRARQVEADLITRTGPKMPLAEFVFLADFPARVSAFNAKVGDAVKAPLITLAVGELAVAVKARPEQATLVRPGMPVQMVSETLGQQATATVTGVGEVTKPHGEATTTPYLPLTITPTQPLATSWAGLDVRVTITSAQTAAEVLVVPLSAVSAGADGRTTVSVVEHTGRSTTVEVRAGVSGDGFVEVTPISGELREGDRVVVSSSQ
jgi:HlyD family secretion protein